ncbi:MAG: hypothetical protein HEP71_20800 [Roseivirga sp.]|nr:hypothetical protein [Roseivirga sp.]
MKNRFLIVLLSLINLVLIGACTSEEVIFNAELQLEAELQAIDNFLAANDIVAEQHPSGFSYIIDDEGSGETFREYCRRSFKLTVHHLDSTYIFSNYEEVERDQGFDFVYIDTFETYACGQIIRNAALLGLEELIKVGGKVRLFVPSALAFGTEGYNRERGNIQGARRIVSIPANSTLLISAEIIKVE